MDKTIIFTIIGSAVAIIALILGVIIPFLIHILNRLDHLTVTTATKEDLVAVKKDLKEDISVFKKDVKEEFRDANTQLRDIRDRTSRIEGQLMPKVFPFQQEKPKKKAKGE